MEELKLFQFQLLKRIDSVAVHDRFQGQKHDSAASCGRFFCPNYKAIPLKSSIDL